VTHLVQVGMHVCSHLKTVGYISILFGLSCEFICCNYCTLKNVSATKQLVFVALNEGRDSEADDSDVE